MTKVNMKHEKKKTAGHKDEKQDKALIGKMIKKEEKKEDKKFVHKKK